MHMLKLLTFGFIVAFLTALSSGGFAGNAGLLFVSSERTNRLVIVDLETKGIVKYLKTSRRPRAMHFRDVSGAFAMEELKNTTAIPLPRR